MSKIKTVEKLITPKIAEAMLEDHYERIATDKFRQRRISETQVLRFVADMTNNQWLLCPQPISFDTDGNLIDGQHRLEAVRRSGKSIPMMVSKGWPVSKMSNGELGTIDIIDRGRTRNVGSQLLMHGEPYGNNLAASVTSIAGAIAGRARTPSISYATTLFILDKLDMRKHINAIVAHCGTGMYAGRTVGPLALYHTFSPQKAEEFAWRLHTMNLQANTGPQIYSRYLRDYSPRMQMFAIAALCQCIMSWEMDESVNRVRQTEDGLIWIAKQNPKLSSNIRQAVGEAATDKLGAYKHQRKGANIQSRNDNATVTVTDVKVTEAK